MAEKRKREYTLFDLWVKKPKSGDENNEKAIDSVADTSGPSTQTKETMPQSSETAKEVRVFQSNWLSKFPWLRVDDTKDKMFCDLCIKHKKNNTLTDGSSNFRTSTLTRHAESKDHVGSVIAEKMQPEFSSAVKKIVSDKEASIIIGMKSVYWLAKENLPMHKYASLLELLSSVDCKTTTSLSQVKNASYSSETTANDMLQSLASVIRSDIDTQLQNSPYVSVFADESTDIGCQKKLVIFARMLDPETYIPSTCYLENIKVPDGTGKVVSTAILDCLSDRSVSMSKVMGFGSDGAKAMTGTGEGVTGHLLRQNPMLLNFHCIAHRLALVSSQAANSIPYLKEYQETLTGMFYFFKASANRTEKLSEIQVLLNEPQLKMTEVHEVRWLSIYKSVETVYRCLDALITVFSTDKEPKAKGYAKKIGHSDFISTTYMLMDILPVITELCLVFQKTELDVSVVEVSVENCKKTLESKKSSAPVKVPSYLDELKDHMQLKNGKLVFKDNHVISKGQRNVNNLKDNFIDSLIEKLDDRFPAKDSNLIFSFGVLGMRPLSFLSKDELSTWGDEKIETLITHFGKEQTHKYSDKISKATPLIESDETKKEWTKVKPLVVNCGYPRDKLSILWGLISKYHKDEFPNLLKLSALAITAPIHTADCERGFSCQNITKTALRNRLSPDRVDDLITISTEGKPLEEYNFDKALTHWREKKHRKIFYA